MSFFGYMIRQVAEIVNTVLSLYIYVIIARALLTWVNPDPYNPIVRFIHNITEPVLLAIRRRLPVFFGGIDFTPLLVIAGIVLLQSVIARLAVML
ncbi:MAG TPA: YggT family protein [Syntrophobacter fumaroxidans]|nr:YggT family protein [Syntrophobacter fumaroxidans]